MFMDVIHSVTSNSRETGIFIGLVLFVANDAFQRFDHVSGLSVGSSLLFFMSS